MCSSDLASLTSAGSLSSFSSFGRTTVDLAAPIVFTPTDHSGPSSFRMFGYDYTAKKYVAFGQFSDYDKYMK